MATKQITNSLSAPDGSQYVTLTDGAGNLVGVSASTAPNTANTTSDAISTANVSQDCIAKIHTYNGASWERGRSIGTANQLTPTGVQAHALIPVVSTSAGIPSTASSAATAAQVLKASAGNLFSVCVNAGASAGYLMIFDATSAPADGAVTPVFSIPVAANGFYTTDWAYPIRCNTGITLVFSTTGPFTKTASATAFLSGQFI